jgi:hypothetical protein
LSGYGRTCGGKGGHRGGITHGSCDASTACRYSGLRSGERYAVSSAEFSRNLEDTGYLRRDR